MKVLNTKKYNFLFNILIILFLIVLIYSIPFSDKTLANPKKPINGSPSDSATDVSLTLTLAASNFENLRSIINPATLSPALWLDASDTSTLFNATSGGSLPSVGSAVARIEDKSGNGRHFTQGTTGFRPLRQEFNGKSILRFDGSDDRLFIGNTNLLRNVTGATIYVVRKLNVLNESANSSYFGIARGTDAVNRAILYTLASGGRPQLGGRTLDADGFVATGTGPFDATPTDKFEVQTGVFNYAVTTLSQYINNTQSTTRTDFQSATTTSNTVASVSSIGTSAGSGQFANADIAEILVFHSAHNEATRKDVWNYLGDKWGLPEATDLDHKASQWQITDTEGNYSSPVFDSGTDEDNLEQIEIPEDTLSGGTTYYWRVRYQDEADNWSDWSDETSFETITLAGLSVEMVDDEDEIIGFPYIEMGPLEFSFDYQVSSGILGTAEQKIRVSNPTGTAQWTLSIEPADGEAALWVGTDFEYDFNDPTANAEDGDDDDSFGGQMSIDSSNINLTPSSGCSSDNISNGGVASFSQGDINSITLVSASGGADTGCFWDITDIEIYQTIPAEQPADNYSIEMMLSIIAS